MAEQHRIPALVADMTRAELEHEWREQENTLMELCDEMQLVGETLWPDEAERPDGFEVEGATGAQLAAGITSLHELVERLYDENASLRAQLAEAREACREH